MDNSLVTQRATQLRQRVARFVQTRSPGSHPVARVIRVLRERRWHAFLFGGVLRDLMIHGGAARPRDVDIVVDGVSVGDLEAVFRTSVVRRTRFGGLHLRVDGWMFDIWPLAETWALREQAIPFSGASALPCSTFLNVEAIAAEIRVSPGRPGALYARGFFESILSRTLDINLEANPHPTLCIVRSLITAAHLRFAIGPRLAAYIESRSRGVPLEELVAVQLAHYGCVRASGDTLSAWLRSVSEQQRHARSGNVVLPMTRPGHSGPRHDPAGRC